MLCLLEPSAPRALEVLGTGEVDVEGGGIVVNSDDPLAMVLTSSGNVMRRPDPGDRGFQDLGLGAFVPPAEGAVTPVPDPLANLPTPDNLPAPPVRSTTPILVPASTPSARHLLHHHRAEQRHPHPFRPGCTSSGAATG